MHGVIFSTYISNKHLWKCHWHHLRSYPDPASEAVQFAVYWPSLPLAKNSPVEEISINSALLL